MKIGNAWYDFIRFLAARRTQLPALTEVRVGTIVWPLVEYVYPSCAFRRLRSYTLPDRLETQGSISIYVAWFLDAEAGLALADSAGRRVRRLAPVPLSVRYKQRGVAYGDEANQK